MKPLTTSVYTFSDLIEGGYLYVDKTAEIHELIRGYKGQYFLSRPRRFGKSLLVSTLKAIFQGRRELFAGLEIDGSDYEWKRYPVIHLDLGTAAAQTEQELRDQLLRGVSYSAEENGIPLTAQAAPAAFEEMIRKLAQRDGKVVILVDEYDKPLLGHLGEPSAKDIQRVLKTFYGVVKGTEAHQRFVLLTGVSKFSRVSVFSDLNNLTDLTMDPRTATLLGYTQTELEANFADYIGRLGNAIGRSREETLGDLRDWYNGYRFHEKAEAVYNPVSVMKCFMNEEFKNYWFETGTPTFLVDLLRRRPVRLDDLRVEESDFSTYDPANLSPLPLLVQTGYLTIGGVEPFGDTRTYRLAYPNREIAQTFSRWLAIGFSRVPGEDIAAALRRMVAALEQGRADEMLSTLRSFFSGIPYDIAIDNEKYYQTIFFTVFKLLGAAVDAETRISAGRIDAVVKTRTDIFVFEFKLHDTAESAMEQIREKRYYEPFLTDGRRIVLVGVAFEAQTRNLGRWLIEPASAV